MKRKGLVEHSLVVVRFNKIIVCLADADADIDT